MAVKSPLRRWKRFFPLFDTIAVAISAAGQTRGGDDEVECAAVLRQAREDVVQLLCDAPEDDAAEDLCRLLDQVMVEYLAALESVPVTPSALASTGLARAVGALQEHESEEIRGLARGVVGRWRAVVETDLAEARARVEELCKLSAQLPKNVANAVGTGKMPASVGMMDKMGATKDAKLQRKIITIEAPKVVIKQQQLAKMSVPLLNKNKKSAPLVGVGRATAMGKMPAMMDQKMEATKRKLREGYQEVEDAKRQRKIVVIDTPKVVERKAHPVIRERSQARLCAASTVARRSLIPSFCRV